MLQQTFVSRKQMNNPGLHMALTHGAHTTRIYTSRVGQNRIYTPYMTVFLVIPLPEILYIHRINMVLANHMVLANSTHLQSHAITRTYTVTQLHT